MTSKEQKLPALKLPSLVPPSTVSKISLPSAPKPLQSPSKLPSLPLTTPSTVSLPPVTQTKAKLKIAPSFVPKETKKLDCPNPAPNSDISGSGEHKEDPRK